MTHAKKILVLLLVLVFGFWLDLSPASAAASSLFPLAENSGVGWEANLGTKVDAVLTDDGDSTYVSATSTGASQTFFFSGAAVPNGASINSVVLKVRAKKDDLVFGAPQLILFAENSGNIAKNSAFGNIVSNSAYADFNWTLNKNPFTNQAWTAQEVNNWTLAFGVSQGGSFGRLIVTKISLSVDYSVHPDILPNPALSGQTCGLDIALVLDNSGSIGGNLPAMKTAFNDFVKKLAPATPTYFSVTYFDGVAHYVLSSFSNNQNAVTSAIASVPASFGQTNWEDGLLKAGNTFDPRPGLSHPNLIIFASDGQPNRYGPGGSLGQGGTVDQNALDAAIVQANIIKSSGTRIITLGIGSSVDQANMEAISGSDAYFSVSDFSQLANTLLSIAGNMCGSTITVTKKLDIDGNLSTTNDQTNAATGFSFNISPGYLNNQTDANGQTQAILVSSGNYSVSESNLPPGYTNLGGSCTGATNNGTASGTTVTNLQVNGNDIVSCVFYNQPPSNDGGNATSSDVSILKTVNNNNPNPGDTVVYNLLVKNLGTTTMAGITVNDILPLGLTFVSASSSQGFYNNMLGTWIIGSLNPGQSVTTTINAKVNTNTAGQVISNTALVSATNDSDLNNNSSTAVLTVATPGGGGGGENNASSSDLSLLKTSDKQTSNPGDFVIYTLVVGNLGPDTATSVTVTDILPSSLIFISSSSTQGSYNATSGIWSVGDLTLGAGATTTILTQVNTGTLGQTIVNSGSVSSQLVDPNLSNNVSAAQNSVPNPGNGGGGGGGSSGGGSSGGGGGGGGGGGIPIPVTSGAILGTTTPVGLTIPAQPEILGASTLPRTGLPVWPVVLFTFLIGPTVFTVFRRVKVN